MLDQHLGAVTSTIDLIPMADITASGNATGVDCTDFVGSVAVILKCKNVAGTTPTLDIKLQDSLDNITYADITGAVFTQVTDAGTKAATLEKISVNLDSARKYIRAVKTIGGTSSPEFLVSCTALGVKQYR